MAVAMEWREISWAEGEVEGDPHAEAEVGDGEEGDERGAVRGAGDGGGAGDQGGGDGEDEGAVQAETG
jgi:hypothetical protein